MIVSDISVKNRTSVFVLVVIIIIIGLFSYYSLPREAAPDVQIPYVFVSTSYRGVAPKDIETSVTIPIEDKLKGLKNVEKISSTSSEGRSSIVVEFVTGTDIELAKQWVKDKVDQAKRELPTDLENDPTVFEINISEEPVIILALSSKMGSRQLKKVADDIKDEIEAIPGVLEVEQSGAVEREIHVEVDPDKLAVYGIPFVKLYSVIKSENQNVSGGNISMGDGRYQLRVPGEFTSPEQIENLIVSMVNGNPVYLRDIAEVKDSHRDITSASKFNFTDSINLYVKKRIGENIIYITDSVKDIIKKRKKTLPKGFKIDELMDRSKEIRNMVADLENNIITGIILVILVLMFAMGLRNSILVGIAIPLSMLLSFSVLQIMGITLNMVTLFALTLSLGMLVDNAIVIVENIYRFVSQGVPAKRAAMLAAGEVSTPVIASTATTVAAFYPLLYWTGIMGQFMKYIPITLITTLLSSLFVALVINPAFCSVFIKRPKNANEHNDEKDILKAGEKPLESNGIILRTYEYVLRTSLNSRVGVLVSSMLVLFLFIAIWLYRTGIQRPIEFFPKTQPRSCYVNIDMPEGMDLDGLKDIETEIVNRLKNYKNIPDEYKTKEAEQPKLSSLKLNKFKNFKKEQGIENEKIVSDIYNIRFIYSSLTTQTGGSASFRNDSLPNKVGIQFHDFDGRVESSDETVERIRARIKGIPGAHLYLTSSRKGPPTGSPINIEISGDDFQILGKIAQKVKNIIKKIPYTLDIKDDYVKGSPTMELIVDRKKAALYGLDTGIIGSTIKTAINGWNISNYREGDDDYDIYVRAKNIYRKDMDIFNKLYIPTQKNGLIPLCDVVTIKYTGGLGLIRRIDNRRVVTVSADVNAAKMPGSVAKNIAEKAMKNYELPAGYSVKFTGENKMQNDAKNFLSRALLIALLLVFLVIMLQFDSLIDTGIIMLSVVLSIGGIFFGLFIANIPFGIIMTGLGVISLAGVVVNNAIVLLDYTSHLIARGYSLTEAVVNAAKTRFRPVLLTAITTVLGLLPMITGVSYDFHKFKLLTSSSSAEFWFPMAISVAFGLTVATFLTLLVIPCIFHLLMHIKYWLSYKIWKKESDREFYEGKTAISE